MQNIESVAILNYQNNMLFFQHKYPILFNKLKALEIILDDATYKQKYDLEYKDGYFNVLELDSNRYLYNTDSNNYSQEMTDKISLQKDDGVIETFYNVEFGKEIIENIETISPQIIYATTAPIIDYYNKNITRTMHMKKIHKFIFLGVGLGLHVDKIVKKTDADVFLVVESDIEFFRLSMFTCSYEIVFKNKQVFFSIAQNDFEFQETFTQYFESAFILNHFFKFSLFSSKDEKYIKKIQTEILMRSETCYPHSHLLRKSSRVLKKIDNNYKFLSMLQKGEQFFEDKPLLILGAGPSLGANKEWLKQYSEYFIIIAPFVTLRVLYTLNISPDIIVHIDEGDTVANRDIALYKDKKDYFKNSLFIFSASVSDIFFQTFEKDKIYLIEDRTNYKLNDNYLEMASVGEAVYGIGLSLSNNDIYLLGLDLAVGDDGRTHTKVHGTKASVDTSQKDVVEEKSDLRTSVIEVNGNFREKVSTIPLFAMSIQQMNLKTKHQKSEIQNIYNLSNGAYFEGTMPLKIDEIKFKEEESQIYGAVSLDSYFTFVGFCKATNSDEICEVDVYMDTKKVATLKADKKIEKVESEFDVKGHGFEFELDKKYFDRSCFLEFKVKENAKELVNSGIDTIEKNNLMFNQYRFINSLDKPLDEEKIKDLYTKDAIGFLAAKENLNDKDFVNYIKELYVRFPQVTFKAFYFDEGEKKLLENLLVKDMNRLELHVLNSMQKLANEIEIYIQNYNMITFNIYEIFLSTFQNIYPVVLSVELINKTVLEINKRDVNHKTFQNLDKFGYTKKDVAEAKEGLFTMRYNKIYSKIGLDNLSDSKNVYELIYFNDLVNVLKFPKFKQYMLKIKKINIAIR